MCNCIVLPPLEYCRFQSKITQAICHNDYYHRTVYMGSSTEGLAYNLHEKKSFLTLCSLLRAVELPRISSR